MFDPAHMNIQNNMYSGMMNPRGMNQMPMGVPMEPQLRDISVPGVNDVMCGRGGGTNNHIGNIRFRQLVNGHKLRYLAATKSEKPMVSREVVTIWRGLQPPGRFLMQEKGQTGNTGRWYDIGDKKAREKASQCLRERTPEVLPFVKKLELQLKLQQEEDGGLALIQSSDEHGTQTAAELSKELLKEQQQAAITAHVALQAYLPPSILKMTPDMQTPIPSHPGMVRSMTPTSNGNMSVGSHSHPRPHSATHGGHHPSSALPPHRPMNRRTDSQEQMKKLAKEIELLQREQAKLEEMAKIEAQAVGPRTRNKSIMPGLPPVGIDETLEPLHPYHHSEDTAPLTKEEYQTSVRVFLGSSSGASSSNRSMTESKTHNLKSDDLNHEEKVRNDSFDKSDLDSMSRGSWMKSVHTFDDVSMSSNVMLSPGSSVKQMMLNDIEPLDIRNAPLLHENLRKSDKSLGKASLSTFESQILENLISPTNTDMTSHIPPMPALPNIDEDDNRIQQHHMPPPTSRFRGSQASYPNGSTQQLHSNSHSAQPPALHSHTPHMAYGARPNMATIRGTSAVSMLSDLSDLSHKSAHPKQKMEMTKMRSDASVYNDNMSDLSEAMGSLDMSTTK